MPSPPSPPALLTAAASDAVDMMPMGAWMTGHLRPSLSVSGLTGHMARSFQLPLNMALKAAVARCRAALAAFDAAPMPK